MARVHGPWRTVPSPSSTLHRWISGPALSPRHEWRYSRCGAPRLGLTASCLKFRNHFHRLYNHLAFIIYWQVEYGHIKVTMYVHCKQILVKIQVRIYTVSASEHWLRFVLIRNSFYVIPTPPSHNSSSQLCQNYTTLVHFPFYTSTTSFSHVTTV